MATKKPNKMLLAEWARENGISTQVAKDAARRGVLRDFVRKEMYPEERYVIIKNITGEDFLKMRRRKLSKKSVKLSPRSK